jgi:hypothetical protein
MDKLLKEQHRIIKSAKRQPDDEWSLEGDLMIGRKNKESAIEGASYTVGYSTAIKNLIPEIIDLMEMSELDIRKMITSDKKTSEDDKKHFNRIPKEILNSIRENKDPHISWCKVYGTGKKWAIDKECNCPGAYIIRKRIKEGMSFKAAKKYVMDNGLM